MSDSELILPDGVDRGSLRGERVLIVNETDLPDQVIEDSVRDEFVESASMQWGHNTEFQTYANQQGSLLARSDYQTPTNVIDEIRLARDLAERDDDVRAAMWWMIAAAYESGMENFHPDEKTVGLFNGFCKHMNADRVHKDLYREYLISAQVNSVCLFTRTNMEYEIGFGDESVLKEESVAAPLVGVLPAENVRVLGNDIFQTGTLAYSPASTALAMWLDEYFNPRTTAGRKAEMGRKDRIAANLFVRPIEIDPLSQDAELQPTWGTKLYLLNPNMVHRTTMPKGEKKYPTPPLTANFALLEAKRLLNILDYALLQGGSNFIVVAKKGTDQKPATQPEIDALKQTVRRTSKTGVLVGDHRLSFEILTPDLESLLNPEKRRLIGRKLAMALLRTPEHGTEEPGTEGMVAEMAMMERVITSDRQDIRRHIERNVYGEIRRRNRDLLKKGTPQVWYPKIILQGGQWFSEYVLKLRDRGDIPRSWAVEAGGYPFAAALQERKRELDNDVDETMAPASVPFSSPNMGPQDNNDGRPPGARDGRPSQDPAAPQRRIQRTSGETIKASWEEDLDTVVRAGVVTRAILEEYPDYEVGRIKADERKAAKAGEVARSGPSVIVPVNRDYKVKSERVLNLTEGLRIVVGEKVGDKALVAKALIFREPEYTLEDAEERVARWGFPVVDLHEDPED